MENKKENRFEEHKNQFDLVGNPIKISNVYLPLSIFSDDPSGLESVSKYLKDIMGMRYCTIADLLNRDDRTIWGACKSATEKLNGTSFEKNSGIQIPVSIFQNRSLSILESLTEYLKEELNLRYCKIAALLNKDQRTIWTFYNRAKKKRKQYGQPN